MKHLSHAHIRMYLLIATVCAFLALAASVFAQGTTTDERQQTQDENINERRQIIEEIREKRENEREEKQQERDTNRENRIEEEEAKRETRTAEIEDREAERQIDMEERKTERKIEMEERKADRKEKIEERKLEIEERKAERKAALDERRQQVIGNLARTAIARLQNAIIRMDDVVDRLDARTQTLAERGVDTTAAEAYLSEARDLLATAEAELVGFEVDIEYVTTSDTPRNDWQTIREHFVMVRDILVDARNALHQAVATLKESVRDAINNQQ